MRIPLSPNECKTLFWNIRGLNDPDKHRTFVDWLHTNKPLFGAILESHIKELSLLPLMLKLCPGWSFVSNHLSDDDGRIVLIWKDPMKLRVIHQSSQTMTCLLTLPNKDPFYYTAVYASNESDERLDLWMDLLHLHSTYDLENSLWFVGGVSIKSSSPPSTPHPLSPLRTTRCISSKTVFFRLGYLICALTVLATLGRITSLILLLQKSWIGSL